MALVATETNPLLPVPDTNSKPIQFGYGTLAFDSAYPTGGEALTLTGMREILNMICGKFGDWVFEWDAANQKLEAYVMSTGLEVANGTDLSTATGIPYMAWGNP